jgi:uncharacterized membrane protein YqhA
MLRQILAGSRYLVVIAVIGSFLASIGVLVYGGLTVVSVMFETFSHAVFSIDGAKHLALECIEIIDLFLLGTVLYIVALGLYDLFIDESLPMPKWLVIADLDDLKAKLLGVVTVLLAVTFLGFVVTWNGSINIVALGIAVGLVLFALGYLLGMGFKTHSTKGTETTNEE